MMISGSITAIVLETWLREHLCRILPPQTLLISDNVRFHRPEVVTEIAAVAGHQALFLPPYSLDFNNIAHDFAALKRILGYAKAPFSGATPKNPDIRAPALLRLIADRSYRRAVWGHVS